MMKKVIAGCLLVAASGLANASLILTNGSFENPLQANGTWNVYSPSIPGWNVTSGPGIEIRNNVVGVAQDGFNFVELDSHSNSSMAQTVSGLTAGGAYEINYWYAPRIGQPASTNHVSVYWNNVLMATSTGLGGSINNWINLMIPVTAISGNNVLKFAALGTSDSLGGNIDNVSLSAVPLPAAAWLFGSALLGFGAMRRKQKAAAKSEMALA